MKYKLNIIEPWDSGTTIPITASIVKETGTQFLLLLEDQIQFKGENARYFIFEFNTEEDQLAFKNHLRRSYLINMVFDISIKSNDNDLRPLNTYRGNFLMGQLMIE